MPERIYSVGGLTRKIRGVLELEVGEIWVEGEVSNHRAQASGHHYFTLKDSTAQLPCVLFRNQARNAKALPKDGLQVKAFGEVTVYEARGQYQLIVQALQASGEGQLQARFEALKRTLHAEGLFDERRKLPLPRFPRTIAIVTSPTGAALQDMLNVLSRRAPWVRVLLLPVRVQGEGAHREIVHAINSINQLEGTDEMPPVDTILVARGGGSLEDLWNFNEEAVARAIAASEIPVISGVGHEIDFTISDFAADVRAPTPSAAAELVAPDVGELRGRLGELRSQLDLRVLGRLERHEEVLARLAQSPLIHEPERVLREHEQSLDLLAGQVRSATESGISLHSERVGEAFAAFARHDPRQLLDSSDQRCRSLADQLRVLAGQQLSRQEELLRSRGELLQSLGPDSIFERGFSLTTDEKGRPISSIEGIEKGALLRTQLADGRLESRVEEVEDGSQ